MAKTTADVKLTAKQDETLFELIDTAKIDKKHGAFHWDCGTSALRDALAKKALIVYDVFANGETNRKGITLTDAGREYAIARGWLTAQTASAQPDSAQAVDVELGRALAEWSHAEANAATQTPAAYDAVSDAKTLDKAIARVSNADDVDLDDVNIILEELLIVRAERLKLKAELATARAALAKIALGEKKRNPFTGEPTVYPLTANECRTLAKEALAKLTS